MANWIWNAKQDLIEYQSVKDSLDNIPEQIAELEAQITSLKGTNYDKTPVQGGMSGGESRILDYIDRKERLKINLEIATAKVNRIDRGLEGFTEREYRVLELAFLRGQSEESICSAMGYEGRNIRYIKSAALKKFTLSMFGIADI